MPSRRSSALMASWLRAKLKLVSVMVSVKCLAILYLSTTAPTLRPISASPRSGWRARRTACWMAARWRSVATSRSSRLRRRATARSGLRHTVGELSRGGARGRNVGRIHDLVERTLDEQLIGFFDLVEDIPDLVRPAALDGDAREDRWQGSEEAATAIDADHLEPLASEAAAEEVGEEALPFGGAFAARQAEVDDLLLAVGPKPKRDQHRPA